MGNLRCLILNTLSVGTVLNHLSSKSCNVLKLTFLNLEQLFQLRQETEYLTTQDLNTLN